MNKKALKFVEGLTPLFFELFGFPTLKFYSDYAEVFFQKDCVIKDLGYFNLHGFDEFRMYANHDEMVIVFTFYKK